MQAKETEPARLKDLRQAAFYLGLSERKVWQMGSDGEIPQVRHGKSVRYDINDLDAWIEKAKKNI